MARKVLQKAKDTGGKKSKEVTVTDAKKEEKHDDDDDDMPTLEPVAERKLPVRVCTMDNALFDLERAANELSNKTPAAATGAVGTTKAPDDVLMKTQCLHAVDLCTRLRAAREQAKTASTASVAAPSTTTPTTVPSAPSPS